MVPPAKLVLEASRRYWIPASLSLEVHWAVIDDRYTATMEGDPTPGSNGFQRMWLLESSRS